MVQQDIKNVVREMISTHLHNHITYELGGSDFLNNLQNELSEKVDDIRWVEPTTELNQELFDKFVDDLTGHVCSGIHIG